MSPPTHGEVYLASSSTSPIIMLPTGFRVARKRCFKTNTNPFAITKFTTLLRILSIPSLLLPTYPLRSAPTIAAPSPSDASSLHQAVPKKPRPLRLYTAMHLGSISCTWIQLAATTPHHREVVSRGGHSAFIRPPDGCSKAEAPVAGPHPADACRPPSAPCGAGAGPTSWAALPAWQPTDGHAPPHE